MFLRSAVIGLVITIPTTVFATCDATGTTIIYVNGIQTSLVDAQQDMLMLQDQYSKRNHDGAVYFRNGYNASHINGYGDLIKSTLQEYRSEATPYVDDYDLHTILMQIHPEVTTRKILLVGHSQGTFYTNELYKYLVAHGVPKESIMVYNIATPASYVAGGGQYLTSANDRLIERVREISAAGNAKGPLSANILIPLPKDEAGDQWAGHHFQSDYMAGAAARIVSDINAALGKLKAQPTDGAECFVPPANTLTYKAQHAIFAVADPFATSAIDTGAQAGHTIAAAIGAAGSVVRSGIAGVEGALSAALNALVFTVVPQPNAQTASAAFAVEKVLYGSSLSTSEYHDLLTGNDSEAASAAQDKRDEQRLLRNLHTTPPAPESPIPKTVTAELALPKPQTYPFASPNNLYQPGFGGGTSAAFAFSQPPELSTPVPDVPPPPAHPTPAPPADLTPPNAPTISIAACDHSVSTSGCVVPSDTVHVVWDSVADAAYYGIAEDGTVTSTTTDTTATAAVKVGIATDISVVAYDAAGNSATSTAIAVEAIGSPLVITEVGWGGTDAAASEQYIEIKNVSADVINLSDITINRTDGTPVPLSGTLDPGTYLTVQRTFFAANGHKLVVPFDALATDYAEQLSLVWSGGVDTATLDATPAADTCASWCAGAKTHRLGRNEMGLPDLMSPSSMERSSDASDGTLAVSWHASDSYNVWLGINASTAALYGTPGGPNSSGYPDAAVLCGSALLTPQSAPGPAVHPDSRDCVYLTRFITGSSFGSGRYGMLFRGDVGSSTTPGGPYMGKALAYGSAGAIPADARPGEHFFFAMWEQPSAFDVTTAFKMFFTNGPSPDVPYAPITNYVVIPWTYAE